MTSRPEPDRWQEIKAIWKENQWLYTVAGFFAGLLALPFIQTVRTDFFTFLQEFVPEAVGIGFTVFIVDRIYRRRETERSEEDLKARLIRELGSSVNEVAKHAAEELRAHGWLEDGTLTGTILRYANLQNANLVGANLSDVNLENANLSGADLRSSNLNNSSLKNSNLQSANLEFARLYEANLSLADLQGANLKFACLNSAILMEANLKDACLICSQMKQIILQGANLQAAQVNGVQFDHKSIMPDCYVWKSDIDVRRYTDELHPDFVTVETAISSMKLRRKSRD